jgi:hypothetical protein
MVPGHRKPSSNDDRLYDLTMLKWGVIMIEEQLHLLLPYVLTKTLEGNCYKKRV